MTPAVSVPTGIVNGLAPAVETGSAVEMRLLRDVRCCCSADVFPSYYEIKGATVHGRATRVDAVGTIFKELEERAGKHGLAAGTTFALPISDDAFGFDFGKLALR
jgi:hypothetical protein